ncbi:MAG: DUF2062 domain-containing protein [Desulfocapsaceae bacterium]|nr:DUF2062 domain-containing protein [Desulfocapsaceae bacterium]
MPLQKASRSLKWLFLRLRPLLRILKGFRGTPEAIAGGFSLGLFLALTPTVGVQIIIAIFLATFFKLSRPAALLSVMVTNPLTVPPIFTFNYWVGKFFFDGPQVREVYGQLLGIAKEMAKLDIWEVGAQIRAFAEIGRDMFIPLTVGSLIVATVAATFSYVLLVRFFWFLKLRQERKRRLKNIKAAKNKKELN